MVPLRRALLPLLLALLAACRFPPFNTDLSLARLTTEKLDRVGVIGPFAGNIDTRARYAFVPERTVLDTGVLQGWILGTGPGYVVAGYSPGGGAVAPGQWSNGLWQDEQAPTLLSAPAAAGRLLLMRLSTPTSWTWIGVLGSNLVPEDPAPPNNDFKGWVASQAAFASMTPNVVGVFVFPPDPAPSTQLRLRFFAPDIAGTGYQEGEGTLNGSSPPTLSSAASASPTIGGLPAAIDRTSFYYYSPATGYSYLSVPGADGACTTYRWSGASAAASLFLERFRVDAVLSTGRLFARDGDVARIYDADGKRLSRFPMGALDYAGEYWDSAEGRLRMVFVLPLITGEQDGGERSLGFEVYSWPTAEVTSLD
jgi:hypothetical protein